MNSREQQRATAARSDRTPPAASAPAHRPQSPAAAETGSPDDPRGKMSRAAMYENAMSVAHGTAHPGISSGRPCDDRLERHRAPPGPIMPPSGGQQRHGRLARRRERTAGQRRLDDFLGRQREEEHHADVVDGEVHARARSARTTRGSVFAQTSAASGARHEQQRVVDDEGPQAGAGRVRPSRRSADLLDVEEVGVGAGQVRLDADEHDDRARLIEPLARGRSASSFSTSRSAVRIGVTPQNSASDAGDRCVRASRRRSAPTAAAPTAGARSCLRA